MDFTTYKYYILVFLIAFILGYILGRIEKKEKIKGQKAVAGMLGIGWFMATIYFTYTGIEKLPFLLDTAGLSSLGFFLGAEYVDLYTKILVDKTKQIIKK